MRYIVLLILALLGMATAFADEKPNTVPIEFKIIGITDKAAAKNANIALRNTLNLIPRPTVHAAMLSFKRQAPSRIRKAIEPFGYFKAKINATYRREGNKYIAIFHVKLGPQILITHLDVKITGEGSTNPHYVKFLQSFPIQRGKPFLSRTYSSTKDKFYEIANRFGFFSAKMEKSKIIINLDTYQASVIFHFNTGPRYRFGITTFTPVPLAISFLRKYLTYKEGDYYDYDKIQKTQQNLRSSAYFRQATLTPALDKEKQLNVPIDAKIIMRKRKRYMFGLGYGTDTGIRGIIGISLRYVNRWGHRFKTYIKASQRNSELLFDYSIPGSNPVNDLWTFNAGIGRIKQSTGQGRNFFVGANYATKILGWNQIISLAYLNEEYNIRYEPRTNAALVYPAINWSRVKSDHPLNPDNGYSLSLGMAGTPDNFTKNHNSGFFQINTAEKLLMTWGESFRVILKGSYAHTDIKNLQRLPLSLQLFTGGANSVRGYSYNSIGPGRNLYTGSLEFQQHMFSQFYFAVFCDTGNVRNKQLFKNPHIGVGPAIVWLSPVGELKLSFANAISQSNRPWAIQFSMGPVL